MKFEIATERYVWRLGNMDVGKSAVTGFKSPIFFSFAAYGFDLNLNTIRVFLKSLDI